MFTTRRLRPGRLAAVVSLTGMVLSSAALSLPSYAASGDRDHDGMPNRWESRHGLNPNVADAKGDKDHDGLKNLREYRHHSDPLDEDTDNDGDDDGDEVSDGSTKTDLLDRDTDGDGIPDGDEDIDHDGIDNEDEDDASEGCRADDEDDDADGIDNEDENELGGKRHSADSDGDGILDGDEDFDEDGEADEDEDDVLGDRCEDLDEDEGDRFGAIVSFDSVTGDLVIATDRLGVRTFVVTADTEIEFDSSGHGSGEAGSTADLVEGQVVAEIGIDDDGEDDSENEGEDGYDKVRARAAAPSSNVLEEIELAR